MSNDATLIAKVRQRGVDYFKKKLDRKYAQYMHNLFLSYSIMCTVGTFIYPTPALGIATSYNATILTFQ